MLGSLTGLVAVTYYTAPYEGVTRLLIIPASLATALFPALSTPHGCVRDGDARRLLAGSVRYLLLALAVPIALLVAFPGEILQTWLGPAFAAESADVVRILSVGVLLNGLAHLPFVYLLGQGRPDVVARFHVLELFLYAVGAWWLVRSLGVTGAALAWTLRVTLDAGLLFAATWRLGGVSPRVLLSDGGGRALAAVVVLVLFGIGVGSLHGFGLNVRLALAAGTAAAYGIYVWRVVLADEERAGLRRSLARVGVGART
jgi:O-antigen/teichoic acid export membrane protein